MFDVVVVVFVVAVVVGVVFAVVLGGGRRCRRRRRRPRRRRDVPCRQYKTGTTHSEHLSTLKEFEREIRERYRGCTVTWPSTTPA